MAEPQFTPGPWEAHVDGRFIRTDSTHGWRAFMGIALVNDTVIERGGKTATGPAWEREANARLIAAAPDLYAACKAMSEFYDDVRNCGSQVGALIDQVAAAIRKAEGREA